MIEECKHDFETIFEYIAEDGSRYRIEKCTICGEETAVKYNRKVLSIEKRESVDMYLKTACLDIIYVLNNYSESDFNNAYRNGKEIREKVKGLLKSIQGQLDVQA